MISARIEEVLDDPSVSDRAAERVREFVTAARRLRGMEIKGIESVGSSFRPELRIELVADEVTGTVELALGDFEAASFDGYVSLRRGGVTQFTVLDYEPLDITRFVGDVISVSRKLGDLQ